MSETREEKLELNIELLKEERQKHQERLDNLVDTKNKLNNDL